MILNPLQVDPPLIIFSALPLALFSSRGPAQSLADSRAVVRGRLGGRAPARGGLERPAGEGPEGAEGVVVAVLSEARGRR